MKKRRSSHYKLARKPRVCSGLAISAVVDCVSTNGIHRLCSWNENACRPISFLPHTIGGHRPSRPAQDNILHSDGKGLLRADRGINTVVSVVCVTVPVVDQLIR